MHGVVRIIAVIAALAVSACGARPGADRLDLAGVPQPVADRMEIALSGPARAAMRDALRVVDRDLANACGPADKALLRESVIFFGYATTATRPDAVIDAYMRRRDAGLRAALSALQPQCAARVAALTPDLQGTGGRGLLR